MNRIKIILMSIICLVLINSISLGAGEINEANNNDQKVPEILLKKISVNIDEVPFEEALKIIADKGSFKLNYNPQLMLSGHTHGGQITFFGLAPILPRGSGKYVSGWYEKEKIKLYVSRGIGTSVIPFRFMSLPEIVCLDWALA
ncbi:MAG: hypothetical protein KAR38_04750 [Calditrichia bacterium]|nr:hypothetical protein [Calditrichia bacterium]